MQNLHRRVAETPVGLNRERDEAVAVGLHSCVRCPLLLVSVRGCGPGGGRGTKEGVDGKWVDDGDVGDGDPAGQHHEDVAVGLRAEGGAIGSDAHAVSEAWEGRMAALQMHCTAGAFGGSMLRPSRWRRPVRTSRLLSSKAWESGRVSSQAEARCWHRKTRGVPQNGLGLRAVRRSHGPRRCGPGARG
jgi:hypothetical protein